MCINVTKCIIQIHQVCINKCWLPQGHSWTVGLLALSTSVTCSQFLRELSAADSVCGCVYIMVSAGCCCVNAAGVVLPLNSGSCPIKWLMRVLICPYYHQDWLVLISDVSSNWFHQNDSCVHVEITWASYDLQFLQAFMVLHHHHHHHHHWMHLILSFFVWQKTSFTLSVAFVRWDFCVARLLLLLKCYPNFLVLLLLLSFH